MHEPMPLPFDTSDEDDRGFKIRGVDADVYIEGMERSIDALYKHNSESLKIFTGRIDALAVEIREAKAVSVEIRKDIEGLVGVVTELRDWLRSVEQEQPRKTRGKR